MAQYKKTDTIYNLSTEQLEQIGRSRHDFVLNFIESDTIFDVERIRLILELGAKKAREMLADNHANSTDQKKRCPVCGGDGDDWQLPCPECNP